MDITMLIIATTKNAPKCGTVRPKPGARKRASTYAIAATANDSSGIPNMTHKDALNITVSPRSTLPLEVRVRL